MADYHTVYKGPEGETTQWDDIQRKLGNLPAKEPVWKPENYAPEQEEAKDKAWLDCKDEQELSDLEDDEQLKDDRFLEEYRQKRLRELQQTTLKPRFGTVEEIRRSEFVQQVTNASSEVRVVVHLYRDGHAGSILMASCLGEVAAKYPATKFVRIVSTDCIPDYPDANLPTLLLYHEGKCVQHVVGLGLFGGQRATPEQVALVLNTWGPFCMRTDDAEEERQAQLKELVQRMVARREEEGQRGGGAGAAGRDPDDEDSDFD